MKTKQFTSVLLGTILILGMALQAEAVTIRHNVTGVSWLSGWLDIDNSQFTAPIKNAFLQTTGNGTSAGNTYSFADLTRNWSTQSRYRDGSYRLYLYNYNPRQRNGASTPFTFNAYETYSYQIAHPHSFRGHTWTHNHTVTTSQGANPGTATAVATPEPASLLLFGSGLAALGYWRHRKNKSA